MRPRLLCPSAGFWLLALVLLPVARAQDGTTQADRPLPEDRTLQKMSGIFDTDLPKTEKKGRIRLILHPHLGDFIRRSYLRIPFGVRWGVNDHVEFTAQVVPFIQHGLRRGPSGYGFGEVQFGGKYLLHKWLKPVYDTSVGINVKLPVDKPPVDLTDGYNHYAPYLTISRKSPTIKDLTYFSSTTLDYMDKSNVAGSFRRNVAHSSSLIFAGGFVLDRYPYHYTLETGYQTTTLVGEGDQQFVFIKPGFAWDLPRKLTFNSKGRWLFGFSVRITQGPEGTRVDTGGKIRGEFSFRRWMNDRKNGENGSSAARR